MDPRRSSPASFRRPHRLLLRIHSAENLRHASSNGTYCKIAVASAPNSHGHGAAGAGGNRPSLKRFLGESEPDSGGGDAITSDGAAAAAAPPREVKTQIQKVDRTNPVWKEKFEIPVVDPLTEVLTIRVKTQRLMSAPVIGACAVPLHEVQLETTDRWINLFDTSKRPAGRIRVQYRLVRPPSLSRRDDSGDLRLTMPIERNALAATTYTRGSISAAAKRDSVYRGTPQHQQQQQRHVEARNSASTATSDSLSSDYSNGGNSMPMVSPYPINHDSFGPEYAYHPYGRSGSSPPARVSLPRLHGKEGGSNQNDSLLGLGNATMGPMSAEELDIENQSFLDNRSSNQDDSITEATMLSVTKDLKDDPSPRTTNNTTISSEEDDDATIEFDFDTGDVRPSTRLPSQLIRRTTLFRSTIRSSNATSYMESDAEDESEEEEDQPEDDEMDPDAGVEFPRVPLRSTITRLLRRQSVNVVMDEEEEEDEDDEMMAMEELPMLDFSEMIQLDDIDCTGRET